MIVPFVIVQLYVAPATAGVLAVPFALGQSDEGAAVTDATGSIGIVMLVAGELPHALFVTRVSVTGAVPASNVIDAVPAPEVIVPFVIVQE